MLILTVYFLETSHILPFIKMSGKSSPLKFFSLTFGYYMNLYNQRPYTFQNICNDRPFSFQVIGSIAWGEGVAFNSCFNLIFMFNLFDTHFFETFIKKFFLIRTNSGGFKLISVYFLFLLCLFFNSVNYLKFKYYWISSSVSNHSFDDRNH